MTESSRLATPLGHGQKGTVIGGADSSGCIMVKFEPHGATIEIRHDSLLRTPPILVGGFRAGDDVVFSHASLRDCSFPEQFIVQGAGGVGSSCNGTFAAVGHHNGKALYKKVGGEAIVYFAGGWKMNNNPDTRGWYYSVLDAEGARPPMGKWTLDGYDSTDAQPTPVLLARRGRMQSGQQGEVISQAPSQDNAGELLNVLFAGHDSPVCVATSELHRKCTSCGRPQVGVVYRGLPCLQQEQPQVHRAPSTGGFRPFERLRRCFFAE